MRGDRALVRRGAFAARLLDAAALLLGLSPSFLHRACEPGLDPPLRHDAGAMNKLHKSFARVGPVLLLRTEPVGADDEHAIAGDAPTTQSLQAYAHIGGKAAGAPHVEPELDRGRHLVDVLPARSRSADEVFFDLRFRDGDGNWPSTYGGILDRAMRTPNEGRRAALSDHPPRLKSTLSAGVRRSPRAACCRC